MPDTTVLEVREPSSSQARTLELGAPSVRIGRGPQCEVRLGEPSLAEVQCLLRRRGDTWHVQPVGPPGYLSIQGRPVESQRPLPLGEPMRVGDHLLMLSRHRAEDLDRTLTVAVQSGPAVGSARSVEPIGAMAAPAHPASKPPQAPASRLIPTRPDDRRWEGRPLGDGARPRIARPAGPSAPRSVREAGTPIRPTRRMPSPAYEAKATPPSFPMPLGGRPDLPGSPVAERVTAPFPRPSTPPPPESPRRLGCATIVREGLATPPPAAAVAVEPASPMASLPGLEAWAAELLEHARAAYPPPTPFPSALLPGPTREVEVIEPADRWADPDPGPVPAATALPPGDRVVLDGPAAELPAPSRAYESPAGPADPGLPVDEPSAVGGLAVDAPAPPVPQIAISFDKPPTGLHRYLASIRRKRRAAPADKMARVVEAMPVVPAEPGPIEVEPVEARRDVESEPADLIRDNSQGGMTTSSWACDSHVAPADTEPSGPPGRTHAHEDEGLPPEEASGIVEASPIEEASGVVEAPPIEASAGGRLPVGPELPDPVAARIRPEIWSREAAVAPPVELPEARPSQPDPAETRPAVAGDWPTARSILDSAARLRAVEAPKASATARRSSVSLPVPTVARPPAQRNLPGLLWIPSMLATLAVGGLGLWLSACQAEVLMSAGPLADRAASHRSATVGDQIQAVAPSKLVKSASWWNSPAESVWPRAWALDSVDGDDNADPARAEAIREWLDRARATSPASPAVRYALVSHATAEDRDRTERWPVGMGRDVLSRAMLGRRLLDEGKAEAGYAAYREALDMACQARERGPHAFDEKQTRRYRLPGEDLIGMVVADLARRPDFRLANWLELLGDRRLPMLAVGRLLKARGNFDGDRLLEKAAEPSPEGAPGGTWDTAAEAEALALLERHAAAEAAYQEAVEGLPEGPARRPLLHNLADIRRRLGDEAGARSTLKLACGDQVDDPIGRRALRVIAEIDRARRGTPLAESRGGGRRPSAPAR